MGNGIAGVSTLYAAKARGWAAHMAPTPPHPHRASGNPAALVNFKPTKAPHTPGNRWLAASLAHIQPLYADLWLPGRGTRKPPADREQAETFKSAYQAMGWGPDTLILDQDGSLISPIAGHISPAQVLEKLAQFEDKAIPDFDALTVYATAYGIGALAPSLRDHLRHNLGQVDVFDTGPEIHMPHTYGGYLTPQHLAGSTYDRDPDWESPHALTPANQPQMPLWLRLQRLVLFYQIQRKHPMFLPVPLAGITCLLLGKPGKAPGL